MNIKKIRWQCGFRMTLQLTCIVFGYGSCTAETETAQIMMIMMLDNDENHTPFTRQAAHRSAVRQALEIRQTSLLASGRTWKPTQERPAAGAAVCPARGAWDRGHALAQGPGAERPDDSPARPVLLGYFPDWGGVGRGLCPLVVRLVHLTLLQRCRFQVPAHLQNARRLSAPARGWVLVLALLSPPWWGFADSGVRPVLGYCFMNKRSRHLSIPVFFPFHPHPTPPSAKWEIWLGANLFPLWSARRDWKDSKDSKDSRLRNTFEPKI